MATAVQAPREVHEACFDFLFMEMVEYVKSSSDHEKVAYQLETLGFRVGQGLVEKYTKDRPRFQDELEIIKFICKDFWNEIFGKQIDNLKTNHRGVYVLHDNKFRWLAHLSSASNAKEEAANYTLFPCGVLRGALANLGLVASVVADVPSLPSCTFTIKLKT